VVAGPADAPAGPRGRTVAGDRPTSQTLDRGLTVLEILSVAAEPMPLSRLSTELGLHKSILYRLLRTLQSHNFVAATPFGYVLGTGAQTLGRRTSPVLQRLAKPEVAKLAATVGLTAFFVVRDGGEAVTLVSVEVESARSRVVYAPGERHPLTLGAPGLAILSADPPRPAERPEIAQARLDGYASTRGEVIPGVATLAAPVRTSSGRAIASVAIVYRVERLGPSHLRAVCDTARILTGRVQKAEAAGAVFPGID
jgi:DNA-binding IclR family transcriptional regulator